MPRKVFITPEGARVEDEAIEVEPISITAEDVILWEYDDPDLSLKRVILDPRAVRLWKAVHETDHQGYPLMSFEPGFEAEPREEYYEEAPAEEGEETES